MLVDQHDGARITETYEQAGEVVVHLAEEEALNTPREGEVLVDAVHKDGQAEKRDPDAPLVDLIR